MAEEARPEKRQKVASDGLSGGVMLVTGASSGVGAAMVRHYAALGWKVAALARRQDLLDEVCKSAGTNASAFACDVADKQKVSSTVEQILQQFGAIDVLVNNAAVGHDGRPFWELDLEDVDKVIDINLKGTMYITHAVLRSMVKSNHGRIFAIASVAGTWGIPNESCYVASKHGMVGFMDTIANETRSTGIVVSTICPGGIDTPWWTSHHPYGDDKSHAAGTTSMLIQPEEIIDLMDYQLKLPSNRVLKRVVFFPKGEWH
eukprot:TRINITY_DN109366_c0_g1_i1.p1 TRINITY_DN109366_c0_g1~~TRINITY_DN109366_c0_g1_i1.p1  ORF type:complete len:260 (-),score=52.36 TRINITY_DN109366_c0_g1_i1:185-964(-)